MRPFSLSPAGASDCAECATLLVEQLREHGVQTTAELIAVDLEVDAGHRRAETLYERLGFRRLDRSRWVRDLTK